MPELIIFVGVQGSGKTTYYREHFAATHVHVSKDLMPNVRDRETRQRQQISQALTEGRSVVVDNTNPTPEVRAPLIELGHRLDARVVAVWMDTPVKTVLARNAAREGKARVPNVAIFATAKKLQPPEMAEGFDEVRVVAAPA
ncbi:MAG TPA: ATP-binding protein [Thermoanaerobaculia bacterium]|nr:ATP-binding protein [Thermoanaerobaculia bacterium]